MNGTHERLRAALIRLLDFVRSDPGLAAEMEGAKIEFFGAERPLYVQGPQELAAAAGRFGEWFMLDRRSPLTDRTPAETWGAAAEDDGDLLRGSLVGVFEVVSADGDDLVLRDLLGRAERRARLPSGPTVQAGDSLIGRLFPAGDRFLCSEAMAIHRGSSLAKAFQRDAERNMSRGMSRRPDQREAELIFWRFGPKGSAPEVPPVEHLEAKLAKFLQEGGIEDATASDLSEALRVAPGPGPVIGPFLERVAFETEADVDALQRILVDLWNAHRTHQRPPAQPAAAAPAVAKRVAAEPARDRPSPDSPCHCDSGRPYASCCLGADAAARIEEGLARGDDLEALFAEVERMVGDEEDEAEDADSADPVAELEEDLRGARLGDLDPFLEEYFWEFSLDPQSSDEPRTLLSLRAELQGRNPPVDDVEGIDLAAVGGHILTAFVTAAPGQGLALAEAKLRAVEQFLAWVRENQSIDLLPKVVEPLRSVLLPALDRADRAAAALGSAASPNEDPPRLMEVRSVTGNTLSIQTLNGPKREREVVLRPDLLELLQPGDLLLGSLSDAGVPAPDLRVVPSEGAPFLPRSTVNTGRSRRR